MLNKKAQMQWWIIGLVIAIVLLVIVIWLYYGWYGKSTEGASFIKGLMNL